MSYPVGGTKGHEFQNNNYQGETNGHVIMLDSSKFLMSYLMCPLHFGHDEETKSPDDRELGQSIPSRREMWCVVLSEQGHCRQEGRRLSLPHLMRVICWCSVTGVSHCANELSQWVEESLCKPSLNKERRHHAKGCKDNRHAKSAQ